MVNSLADVVEQAGTLRLLDIDAKFSGHDTAEERDLQRVLQDILAVGGTVTQPADQLDDLGMDAMHTDIEGGLFPGLTDRACRPPARPS